MSTIRANPMAATLARYPHGVTGAESRHARLAVRNGAQGLPVALTGRSTLLDSIWARLPA